MDSTYTITDGDRTRRVTREDLVSYLDTCQIHAMVIDRSDDMVVIELLCSGGREVIRVGSEQILELKDCLPESFRTLLEKQGLV